jgi:5,10-methylene-tetrahydrofolate dehydrogenase/methenyl tetrahydrofolate cyclohydrolase
MNRLNGKVVADNIINQIKQFIDEHINQSKQRLGYTIAKPSIVIILVGNNPASESYVIENVI